MRMETVDRWRICLCLFVTVFSSSRGNHHPTSPGDSITAMPSDTPVFNLNSTVMGINNSTASTANTINDTVPQADIGSTMAFTSMTPSLTSETSFNNSLEKSTVSMLTTAPNISNLTQKSGLANNDTSSDLQRSVNNSSPIPKFVSPSVSSVVTESNEVSSTVKITAIPKQTETSVKVSSTYKDSMLTVKSTGMSSTSAGQKESKDATSSFPTEQSPVSTTLPMQPTSKTRLTSMTTSGSVMPSTVIMRLSTSHTSPTTTTTISTTTATTVRATARRGTTINIATTSFSVQHIEGNLANTKEMVNGRPVSNPNGTRMDPLVIGLTTVFFIIIGIVSILGFLKYRQRNNQPEFRRLHELPMDDMMEEDTPLSLYSY
ncbi:mucin-3A-like [Chiloscyllium plagiosum]|uniref:mucin-3A-like n=1 Tax=Chiloscyllium plagiosum TaxID=36176 RepID=UPI001CB81A69|nr:mucin-3A-like [Chiloscyllium plagiosum]